MVFLFLQKAACMYSVVDILNEWKTTARRLCLILKELGVQSYRKASVWMTVSCVVFWGWLANCCGNESNCLM